MFVNIPFNLNIYTVKIELEQGSQRNEQIIEAPEEMIKDNFLQMVRQALYLTQPVRIKFSRTIWVEDTTIKKFIPREIYMEFKNNAYLDLHKEK